MNFLLGPAKRPLTWHEQEELFRWYSARVNKYLDSGRSDCWLMRPEIADLIAGAMKFHAADAKAVGFMKIFFRNFGRSLANLIDVLDPDVVVLGGGVSNFDALYTEGVAEVAKQVFSDSLETPIVKHELGDSAGVIGAALIGV